MTIFMTNILKINLWLQALIFISVFFYPNYFGILMNFPMLFLPFLFVYHLIASVILIFIRLVIVKNGQTRIIPRAIIGILSICAIILSIVNSAQSPFSYPYKIDTLLYVWAKNFPIRTQGLFSVFLAILFSIVSWNEFKAEQGD